MVKFFKLLFHLRSLAPKTINLPRHLLFAFVRSQQRLLEFRHLVSVSMAHLLHFRHMLSCHMVHFLPNRISMILSQLLIFHGSLLTLQGEDVNLLIGFVKISTKLLDHAFLLT